MCGPHPVFQSSGGARSAGPFRLNNCGGDVAHFPDRLSSAGEPSPGMHCTDIASIFFVDRMIYAQS